jgi:hypothetical protein
MRAKLSLIAGALCLCSCATPFGRDEPQAIVARIADHEELRLPSPPGYPETQSVTQVVRANYGRLSGVFEASMELSPERVDIVVTAPAGPRLATIAWTASGVDVDRTLLAPVGLPVENILSDVFVMWWPIEAVKRAAPSDCDVIDAEGGRTVSCAGAPIIEIRPDPENPDRKTLRNLDLGYELSITRVQ